MRRWNLLPIVVALSFACGGEDAPETTPAGTPAEEPPPPAASTDPAAGAQTPPAGQQGSPQAGAQQAAPARTTPSPRATQMPVSMPAVDEPWTPTDTGTVSPGMTRDDVIAAWGAPVAERAAGGWTYLYYRNGCELSCGTFDVVFLENGQVVDAIVRWSGHGYAGTSTSPPGKEARATIPPGGAGS